MQLSLFETEGITKITDADLRNNVKPTFKKAIEFEPRSRVTSRKIEYINGLIAAADDDDIDTVVDAVLSALKTRGFTILDPFTSMPLTNATLIDRLNIDR